MTSNTEERSILPKKRKDAPLVTSDVFEGSLFTSVTEQDFKECHITPDNKISVYDAFGTITRGTAKQVRKMYDNIRGNPQQKNYLGTGQSI